MRVRVVCPFESVGSVTPETLFAESEYLMVFPGTPTPLTSLAFKEIEIVEPSKTLDGPVA